MELDQLIAGLEKLLSYMFGGKTPSWLLPTIAWSIGIGFLLFGIGFMLGQIKKLWIEFIQPIFYNPEDLRRRTRRQMFSDFLQEETRRLNTQEAWNDNRFAELEAEVEAEGERFFLGVFNIRYRTGSNLRKEKSLSRALEHSSERLILVEGDPGSGKSVALRHLARSLCKKSGESRNLKSIIPIYINLKYIKRSSTQSIDQNLIENFIFSYLNRINDRDVEEFLSEEFQRGQEEGTWLFLFDSFDEIPDILSSTESDNTIREYAQAINDFLHSMNRCRGVVASREYKGPRFLGWPRFCILPLSLNRQIDLIQLTKLPIKVQSSIVNGIALAQSDFKAMSSNPMFLNLLCEYMHKKDIPEFPQHTHMVFDEYIWKRLRRDEERLIQRFNKTPLEVRDAAEKIAFCMTANTWIGLSPTMEQLKDALISSELDMGIDFDTFINALEYLKFARIETNVNTYENNFTFAHRRFQEYFATSVVLKEPDRVALNTLLGDARWRETLVVLLQTQPIDLVRGILDIIFHSLEEKSHEFGINFESFNDSLIIIDGNQDSLNYKPGMLFKKTLESYNKSYQWIKSILHSIASNLAKQNDDSNNIFEICKPLDWPKGMYHLLSILQDGLVTRNQLIPDSLRGLISKLCLFIVEKGSLDDKKWGIEISGNANTDSLMYVIWKGFVAGGNWVKKSSFLQLSRLPKIHPVLRQYIIRYIVNQGFSGELRKQRNELYAQLSKINDARYLQVATLMFWMPIIDHSFTGLFVLWITFGSKFQPGWIGFWISFLLLSLVIKWYSYSYLDLIAEYSTKLDGRNNPITFGFNVSIWGLVITFGSYTIIMAPKTITINSLIPFVLLFYFCLWPLFAVGQATSAKRVSLGWWITYWLNPIQGLILGLFQLIQSILISILDNIYIILRLPIVVWVFLNLKNKIRVARYLLKELSPLFSGFITLLILSSSFLYKSSVVIQNTFSQISIQNNFAYFLLVGMLSLMIFFSVGRSFYDFTVKTYLLLASLSQTRNAKLTITFSSLLDFIQKFDRYKNPYTRLYLLRKLTNNQNLMILDTDTKHLRNLISFVQHNLKLPFTDNAIEKLKELDQDLAIRINQHENNWDNNQLDILCQLLESSRKKALIE